MIRQARAARTIGRVRLLGSLLVLGSSWLFTPTGAYAQSGTPQPGTEANSATTAEEANEDRAGAETAEGPEEEKLNTARMHFKNGVELLQAEQPNYQDAFRQFQLAYELTDQSWKVMGNLGLCALKLERDGEALTYYEGYLEQGGDEIDPGEREYIEREMLLIKGNMATVNVSTSSAGARLSVTRQGSSVPPQIYDHQGDTSELGLRAGTLTIKATSPDGATSTWQATVEAGETVEHHFDFEAKEEPPPAAEAKAPPQVERKGLNGMQIGGIAAAGAGVVALGGGVALGLMSMATEAEARDDCFDEICAEDTRADFDKAKNQALIANILFISGGVLAAAGVTLIVVGSTSSSGPQDTALVADRPARRNPFSLELSPMAHWGGGGLWASGRF